MIIRVVLLALAVLAVLLDPSVPCHRYHQWSHRLVPEVQWVRDWMVPEVQWVRNPLVPEVLAVLVLPEDHQGLYILLTPSMYCMHSGRVDPVDHQDQPVLAVPVDP